MQICIAGWYFEQPLMDQLDSISYKYPVWYIIDSKRHGLLGQHARRWLDVSRINKHIARFPALEFSKYDYFIKNFWNKNSSVLFMHDDIRIHDIGFFDRIAALEHDHAYIFQNEEKALHNQRWHGRAFYCSPGFIAFALKFVCNCPQATNQPDRHNPGAILPGCGPHRGFWFDRWNESHATGKPPPGIRHYNDGIYHFALFAKRCGSGPYGVKMDTDVKAYFPEFEHGKRGNYK